MSSSLPTLATQTRKGSEVPDLFPIGAFVLITTGNNAVAGTINPSNEPTWLSIQQSDSTITYVRRSAIETIRLEAQHTPIANTNDSDAEKPFKMRFEIEVPAKGLIGEPPKREANLDFVLPNAYEIRRSGSNHGAKVDYHNLNGLAELEREFQSISNGVNIVWALENETSFPVSGRKAVMDVEVIGIRRNQMALSPKYNALRQRFFNQFYFDGLVAEYIDRRIAGGKVKFADQTIYMGQALIALATELPITRENRADTRDAIGRIQEILDAIDELDQNAEPRFGADGVLDGFFTRDNISGPDDSRLGGRFAECESDWQFPERESASPSIDQILGLMYGLWAVVRFSRDDALMEHAKAISGRLYEYARRNYFLLTLPNGELTRRGSDARWLASLMHGLNKDITGRDLFEQSRIKVLGAELSLRPIATFWDDPETAQQISRLVGRNLRLPIINEEVELNAFAMHLLLMVIASGDVWSQNELEKVAVKSKHHLAVLIYCAAHNRNLPTTFQRSVITNVLDACPATGPQSSLAADTGWNKDNRWIRCLNLGEPGDGYREFNGLDWMILHNLDQLVFVGE